MLGAVEQHHRKPVPELGTQSAATRGGLGVDVGDDQPEAELGGQLGQPVSDVAIDTTTGTAQQFDAVMMLGPVHGAQSDIWLGLSVAPRPANAAGAYRREGVGSAMTGATPDPAADEPAGEDQDRVDTPADLHAGDDDTRPGPA